MADYDFERQCRTPYSEAYIILEGEERVGRVDLHFTHMAVEALLCIVEDFPTEDIQDLIDTIDEELVLPAGVARDDFIVTVFRGQEVGVYSDEIFEEEEEGRNGNNP